MCCHGSWRVSIINRFRHRHGSPPEAEAAASCIGAGTGSTFSLGPGVRPAECVSAAICSVSGTNGCCCRPVAYERGAASHHRTQGDGNGAGGPRQSATSWATRGFWGRLATGWVRPPKPTPLDTEASQPAAAALRLIPARLAQCAGAPRKHFPQGADGPWRACGARRFLIWLHMSSSRDDPSCAQTPLATCLGHRCPDLHHAEELIPH